MRNKFCEQKLRAYTTPGIRAYAADICPTLENPSNVPSLSLQGGLSGELKFQFSSTNL